MTAAAAVGTDGDTEEEEREDDGKHQVGLSRAIEDTNKEGSDVRSVAVNINANDSKMAKTEDIEQSVSISGETTGKIDDEEVDLRVHKEEGTEARPIDDAAIVDAVDSNAIDAIKPYMEDDEERLPTVKIDESDVDNNEDKVDDKIEDQAIDLEAIIVDANTFTNEPDVSQQHYPRLQKYRVIDDPKNSWTAEDDLRLLDGILACGLGNWPEIAEHINGGNSGEGGGSGGGEKCGKTDKQCMERYLDDFMGRYGHILPPYTMVLEPEDEGSVVDDRDCDFESATQAAAMALDGADHECAVRKRPRRSESTFVLENGKSALGFKKTKFRVVPTEELDECRDLWPHPYIPPNTGVKLGDEVARDLWYRSEQSFVRQTTGATSKDEEIIRREFIERRAQNLAGYEAKVLPPRLEDTKQLPGAELAGYMPRRGDFDMEWENDAEKTIAEMEFTSDDTKEDRELKLDVLRIFNTKLDEREKRKQFIVDHGLLNYRENQEKLWRMPPDERHLVQRMRLFARFHTREEHEAFLNKIIEAKRLRKEIAKLQMYRRIGITSLADAEKYEMDKVRRELHREAWIKKEEEKRKAAEEAVRAAKENATTLVPPPPPVPSPIEAEANQSLQVWKQFKISTKAGSEIKSSGPDNDRAKFIIKDRPGYELLSRKEVALCKRLRLLPQNYLDVKRALISETLAKGIWNPMASTQKQNRSIFKVDVTQRDNIIDFVLEAGWIPTRPSIID
jgi:transcriptional adapter 2-alpha